MSKGLLQLNMLLAIVILLNRYWFILASRPEERKLRICAFSVCWYFISSFPAVFDFSSSSYLHFMD